jgi:hypothetical protein
VDAGVAADDLVGSSPDYNLRMAALKRDNGVLALEYDLWPMARANLEEAVQQRANDPRAHYYLGKLYSLTGRTADEKQQALAHIQNAIRLDGQRRSFPDPLLEHALHLIARNDPASNGELRDALKKYVEVYQSEHAGNLPPNMYVIYDYLLMAGEESWYVPPVSVILPAASRKP